MTGPSPDCDIAIVGGGLSGTLAAIVLGRAGHRVVLIDRNAEFPPEFRVEKIGGEQVAKFARLGLLDTLAATATRVDGIVNVRNGRILDRTRTPHYGILYQDLVTAMRGRIPAGVTIVFGRVTDIAAGPERQAVTVASHGAVTARLVVLASGMSDLLRAHLGIEREVLFERQSLTFGFDLEPRDGRFRHLALTHYGRTPADGIDYLSAFPIDGATRANLFTFLDHRHPWVKQLRQAPDDALAAAMPGLARALGPYRVASKVQNWIMDLGVARNVRQPGIVLIGDAFQTSCPAAGTGVSRLLTDVERLCTIHVPAWLATPGMDAGKIAAFYDDPEKQAMDARALGLAAYRRDLTIGTSLGWRTHRRVLILRRRLVYGIDRLSPGLASGLRRLRARVA